MGFQATLKKSLFPVQRVAKIVASRAAAKSSFFNENNFCGKNDRKVFQPVVIYSPGR